MSVPDLSQYASEVDPKTGQEYFIIDSVPIFDEHEGDVSYDAKLLARIANNNNQRANETGDLCPLVSHHTPEDKDPNKAPFILGYADKFRLGKFGENRKRWAIYARFKVLKEMAKEFFARPRRSVEIWPEDAPEKRFFDPIALLGAETPRRDLGLIYRYTKGGSSLHYSMAPSATNAAMPEMIEPHKYAANEAEEQSNGDGGNSPNTLDEKGQEMQLDEASINQIVQALVPTIEKIVTDKLAAQAPAGDAAPESALPPDDMEENAASATDDEDSEAEGLADGEIAPGQSDESGEDSPLPKEDEEETKQLFAKTCEKYGKDDERCKILSSMDAGTQGKIRRYMKHHASNDEKKIYERCCVAPQQPAQYRKETEVLRYQRELETIKVKYAKATTALKKANDQVIEIRLENAELNSKLRYQKHRAQLAEIQPVYNFDLEEELAGLMRMTDEEATHHVTVRIPTRYQKVPVRGIPVAGDTKRPDQIKSERSMQYAKRAGEVTTELRTQVSGKFNRTQIEDAINYAKVLGFMTEHNREPNASDLGLKV